MSILSPHLQPMHTSFILTTTLLLLLVPAVVMAQIDGLGGTPKFCPPYRCVGKDEEPVPKWPLQLQSTGCNGMGGMTVFSAGSSNTNDKPSAQDMCCDLRHACLQTCGAPKDICDMEFTQCVSTVCDTIHDVEEKKQCEQSVSISKLMVQMEQSCKKYDDAQRSHCECVPKQEVPGKRERVLRAFYNKFNRESIDKVEGLAKKADTSTKMVGLLLKLYKKYPEVIQKVQDPQQDYMEKIMKESREKEKTEPKKQDRTVADNDESEIEDLGTEEL